MAHCRQFRALAALLVRWMCQKAETLPGIRRPRGSLLWLSCMSGGLVDGWSWNPPSLCSGLDWHRPEPTLWALHCAIPKPSCTPAGQTTDYAFTVTFQAPIGSRTRAVPRRTEETGVPSEPPQEPESFCVSHLLPHGNVVALVWCLAASGSQAVPGSVLKARPCLYPALFMIPTP